MKRAPFDYYVYSAVYIPILLILNKEIKINNGICLRIISSMSPYSTLYFILNIRIKWNDICVSVYWYDRLTIYSKKKKYRKYRCSELIYSIFSMFCFLLISPSHHSMCIFLHQSIHKVTLFLITIISRIYVHDASLASNLVSSLGLTWATLIVWGWLKEVWLMSRMNTELTSEMYLEVSDGKYSWRLRFIIRWHGTRHCIFLTNFILHLRFTIIR